MSFEDNIINVLSYLKTKGTASYANDEEIISNTGVTQQELNNVFAHCRKPLNYIDGGKGYVNITTNGMLFLEALPKTQEKENLEMQKLRTDVQLITNQLADYTKTRRNAKWALILSICSVAISLLALLKK